MSIKAIHIMNSIDTTWKNDLQKSRCPMLLITADVEKGAIVSKEIAAFVKRTNPLIRSIYIPGAGHSIHREKYSEVIAAIEGFITEVK
jgi:N-formylmaleamate deformylase